MRPEREESQTTDADLVRAVARGDEKAYASLYDRYASILLGLLIRILHSRAEAEDVLQDVFLQVWQRAKNFDETRGRAFTWLVTLTRSRAIDRLRSLASRDRVAEESVREVPVNVASDAVADAMRAEQSETISRALAELPEEQRRTISLAYFDGLTQTEIADRTGEPLGTVKTRTRAGLKKLRDLLSRAGSKL